MLMSNTLGRSAVAAALVSIMILFTGEQAGSTVFAAWRVTGLQFGDTLNARKYPSSQSQKQAAYPNGTVLQMTGKCTGGVNLLSTAGQPAAKQASAVRHAWCQIWHDPARDGNFITGWVYGRYIEPD
jgi:hypothetical protein